MEPNLYTAYTNALANGQSGVVEIRKILSAAQDDTNKITLCIKNYPVKGLSSAIHNRHKTSIFNVSGPLGRPLVIDTNGLNVAFVAGTGVLPFMDLVGFITRKTL